jgi:hypothetical protein
LTRNAANAVGKTTTLELFPLFFGTPPSQITETVGGREPLLKFVLPMPYSAIAFEYQCGSDEAHDVRCAVLRLTTVIQKKRILSPCHDCLGSGRCLDQVLTLTGTARRDGAG